MVGTARTLPTSVGKDRAVLYPLFARRVICGIVLVKPCRAKIGAGQHAIIRHRRRRGGVPARGQPIEKRGPVRSETLRAETNLT